ncbi:MerR family transcriptional regulator [Desertibacillus haloalkaliphilus]|uniref:MerR family transcriptional regulator n=1 Tax=Desertibacillus haloalkaliphilus TaxID=1328930 RepID=UPI001C257E68|nr:MerR family transcriptional regulator [Desertibacillus haloalkaliphilus]MBU8907208.1 MerR family transcriptional regulator [Desertibacillus haloalkaliphilus]
MSTQTGKYNIKAIANMVGIQPGTLRAWERRYQVIEPIRNEVGHRLYTDEHVETLRWLVNQLNKGITIGQAVEMLQDRAIGRKDTQQYDFVNQLTEYLLDSLLSFDEERAKHLLNQAFGLYTVEKVVFDVMRPLLVNIGELWKDEQITVAHEHFVTGFIRAKLTSLIQSCSVNTKLPKAVAVCSPREQHELGLLFFTLFLRRKGFDVIYLGVDVPERAINDVIKEVEPNYLFVSCSTKDGFQETLDLIRKLKVTCPEMEIGVGGQGVCDKQSKERQDVSYFVLGSEIEEWEGWLTSGS